MNRLPYFAVLAAAVCLGLSPALHAFAPRPAPETRGTPAVHAGPQAALEDAYLKRLSKLQVRGAGTVVKLLRDDREGSRHQRFLLRLASGRTLLVVHNIDLAPRIETLKVGDQVAFEGEYEWNPHGGMVHWTHHDPQRRHRDGWILHDGQTYR